MHIVPRRVRAYLTLLFFALLFLSCREANAPVSASTSIPFGFSCSAGDRFIYDGWVINQYGYLVSKSKATYVWNVRATDVTLQGRQHVILIVDSARFANDSSAVIDSVYLAVDPNGDLYQYGFLAYLAATRANHTQPKQWDLIAAFSQGPGSRWEVGTWDSAGVERMYGTIQSGQDLFSVAVNGVNMVFPGYQVDIESASLRVSFALSNAPPAVLDIDEEPYLDVTGRYRELREIVATK
jgi:hypothetical protein